MGILIRDGVPPPETWEPRHMMMEKQGKPRLQSADELAALRRWPALIIIAGVEGGGRAEWVLSLAFALSGPGQPVYLSDLTEERSFLRNPMVAVRIRRTMPDVHVLDSDAEEENDDVSLIKPAIERVLKDGRGRVVLDIGSSVSGASVLNAFERDFAAGGHDFFLVVNPFNSRTADADNVRALKFLVEDTSGFPVTGLVVDTYRGCDDEPKLCAEGAISASDVAQELKLPLLYVLTDEGIAEKVCALLPAEPPVWSLPYYAEDEGGDADVPGQGW